LTYNQPGSDICIMTQALSDLFEAKFLALKSKVEEKRDTLKSGMEETINELRNSMKNVQQELQRLRQTKKRPRKAVNDDKEMSFDEKKKLSLDINPCRVRTWRKW